MDDFEDVKKYVEQLCKLKDSNIDIICEVIKTLSERIETLNTEKDILKYKSEKKIQELEHQLYSMQNRLETIASKQAMLHQNVEHFKNFEATKMIDTEIEIKLTQEGYILGRLPDDSENE